VNGEVLTPDLDGCILDGITRKCIIELLKANGHKVTERPITIEEIADAHKAGQLSEVFGSGTAAVIAQVELIQYKDYAITLNPESTPVASFAKNTINGMRNRTLPDTMGWIVPAKS
jgi:branched-chain amino acid aminotransferase